MENKKYEIVLGEGTESNPAKVGALSCPNPTVVRIVHISDTHLQHDDMIEQNLIPAGDILIHSGDFSKFTFRKHIDHRREFTKDIHIIDEFFGRLPHKHKIFVAGNHDMALSYYSPEKIQRHLSNAIILEDSSVTLEGIKFYGAPWNNWRFWAFSRAYGLGAEELGKKWKHIPEDTDVMVTHLPPHGFFDTGRKKFFHAASDCDSCPKSPHPSHLHWGCPVLRETLLERIRPAAHLFGHLHGCNGITEHGGVVFSNSALALARKSHVIDFYLNNDGKEH